MADLSNLFNFLSRFAGSNASEKLLNLEKAHGNGDGTLLRSELRDAVSENFDMIEVYGWNGEISSAKDLADKWFESMDSNKSQSKIEGTPFTQWGALNKSELNDIDKELEKAIAKGWESNYNGDIEDFETVNRYRKGLETAKAYINSHAGTISKLMPNNADLKNAVETIGKTEYKIQNYTKQDCKNLEKLYSVITEAVEKEEGLQTAKKVCKEYIAFLQKVDNAEINAVIKKYFGDNPTAKINSYTELDSLNKDYSAFKNEVEPIYNKITNTNVNVTDNNNNNEINDEQVATLAEAFKNELNDSTLWSKIAVDLPMTYQDFSTKSKEDFIKDIIDKTLSQVEENMPKIYENCKDDIISELQTRIDKAYDGLKSYVDKAADKNKEAEYDFYTKGNLSNTNIKGVVKSAAKKYYNENLATDLEKEINNNSLWVVNEESLKSMPTFDYMISNYKRIDDADKIKAYLGEQFKNYVKERFPNIYNKFISYIDTLANDFGAYVYLYTLHFSTCDEELYNGETLSILKDHVKKLQDYVEYYDKAKSDEEILKDLTFDNISNVIDCSVKDSYINFSSTYSKINPEFGIDKDGNIMFQYSAEAMKVFNGMTTGSQYGTQNYIYDSEGLIKVKNYNCTQTVGYIWNVAEKLYNALKNDIKDYINASVPKLAKYSDSILQAAWIMTYNSFTSGEEHDSKEFVDKVLRNTASILNKVKNNESLIGLLTTHTALRDTSLLSGTYSADGKYTDIEYGTDSFTSTTYYKYECNTILKNLKAKYTMVDEATIEKVWKKASEDAIKAMKDNTADMPCGCATGSGVYDDVSGFKGTNVLTGLNNASRAGDSGYANLATVMEVSLYYFDKYIYNEVFGS